MPNGLAAKRASPKPPAGSPRDLQERIRALEEATRRLRARLESIPTSRLLPLGEIAEEFNTLDLDRIAKVATQRISKLVGARLCSLFLYDYETQELVLAAHTHPRPLPERIALKAHPPRPRPHRKGPPPAHSEGGGRAPLLSLPLRLQTPGAGARATPAPEAAPRAHRAQAPPPFRHGSGPHRPESDRGPRLPRLGG